MDNTIISTIIGSSATAIIFIIIMIFNRKNHSSTSITKYFEGHVNDNYLESIKKHSSQIDVQGSEKVISVMFCDIRGFTSLSEKLSNKMLFKILNKHLSVISKIIINHGGTIDKFLGDGTMAFWGSPLYDRYHATNALKAAFEIKKYFDQTELGIGIGINTGSAILGKVGRQKMKSYTAIGDTVNLSARIESLNKLYGTNILLSNNTYKRLKKEPRTKRPDIFIREVDKVKVYGKRKSTVLYELVDLKEKISQKDKEGYEWFEMGLTAYRKGNWYKAEKFFRSAQKRLGNDRVSKTYIDRCKEFSITPPVGRWDGAVSLSKL